MERTAAICADIGASLRLVTFAVRGRTVYTAGVGAGAEDMVLDRWVSQATAAQDGALKTLQESGNAPSEVDNVVASGRSWGAAIDRLDWDHDEVLVVGSSSAGVIERIFLSSNASKIVRHSPVPVVVVPDLVGTRSSTSRRSRSAQVSRRTTVRHDAVPGEHHGQPPVAVVVVGHREAVGAGGGHDHQVAHGRSGQVDVAHQDVAALAVPADELAHLVVLVAGGIEPPDDARLEPLVEQRDLEVVAHAAVHGDERVLAALHGHHRVDRAGRRRHHAAAGLDDQLGVRGQVRPAGLDQGVEVRRDVGGSSDQV